MVDQAVGAPVAVHRVPPNAGFEVLREVSQHTDIKLHTVAETVIGWALGQQPLPEPVGEELDAAVQRCSRQDDTHRACTDESAPPPEPMRAGGRAQITCL
ncbi:ANTAR domain-containing protein [Streptomyces sp. NPDC005859]|uniref:ANTAR domain-containing protein n=1 Tax=Streptomyces sp. NPDC005859 TaxID=3157170 RepID=UPI0033EA44C5